MTDDASQVHGRGPRQVPRGRVPQQRPATSSTRRSRRRSRSTSAPAAASSASTRRSRPSRTGSSSTDVLGTRADGRDRTRPTRRSRSPTACTTRARGCPEYWTRNDRWYNFTTNVRGLSHVLATVDENHLQPAATIEGAWLDHPVAWCKDYQGGRSFYTGVGARRQLRHADFAPAPAGAIQWAAGKADPVYSDCGATVLANYQQTKIAAPPNLNEPIGFDQLPDGRVMQTARGGRPPARPRDGTSKRHRRRSRSTPTARTGSTGRRSTTTSRTNHWVYLYYAPPTVEDVTQSDGTTGPSRTTPSGAAPITRRRRPGVWDALEVGYFQLSRFKFVDGAERPHLDLGDRAEDPAGRRTTAARAATSPATSTSTSTTTCGWSTGDDTPAGGGNSGGFSPQQRHEDRREPDRARHGRDGRHVHADVRRPDDGADRRSTRRAADDRGGARGALQHRRPTSRSAAPATPPTRQLPRAVRAADDVPQMTATRRPDRRPLRRHDRDDAGGRPVTARRSSTRAAAPANTNDLRGKVLRSSRTASRRPSERLGGAYTIPAGNLFPPSGTPTKTRPEIYAMGFRNPFRIQVDENDVAYVTDYSPDSRPRRTSAGRRAPAASRSSASRPTTAGRCATSAEPPVLPLELQHRRRRWTRRPSRTSAATPTAARRTRRAGTLTAASASSGPGRSRRRSPSRTSGTRTATTPTRRWARRASRTTTASAAGHAARSCSRSSYTGGVGPHGAAPSTTTTRTTRARRSSRRTTTTRSSSASSRRTRCARSALDSKNKIFKINQLPRLRRGAREEPRRSRSSATTRWTCSSAPTAASTC